jgi:hypothetical protein
MLGATLIDLIKNNGVKEGGSGSGARMRNYR